MTELEKSPPTKPGGPKKDLAGEALVAAMKAPPHRDLDIEPKRTSMPVRDVDL